MALNTKLDLYDGKAIQCANQTLTLSGKTVIATSGDLRYQTHPTFTGNTQIVDKCYVDTASGGISGSNGLCRCGNNIVLGGALTGATTLTASNGTSLLFTDSRTTPIGIQYGGDYCTAFQVRSLVDAGYVTGKTSQASCAIAIAPVAVTGATNGICKYDSHNVCLTSINQTILSGTVTGATNLGSGNGTIYTSISDRKLQLKTLSGGTNITLTCNGNYIGINTPTLSVPVTGAANGLCVCGKNATLGGALTGNTCITGAYEFDLNVNKVNITGATGGISLGGNVFLKTVPADALGDVLTYNAITGVIQKTTLSTLGGVTGATNGIGTTGQKVCLGGALIASTSITGAQALCLGTVASKLATLDFHSAGNITIGAGNLLMSSSGATFTDLSPVTKQGIKYASDYSLTYDSRSLVDKGYVDTVATGLQVRAAAIVATTVPITLSANQTIDGILTTTGMRVLVKNQANATTNGIYSANTGAWGRTSDFDASIEVSNGDLIPVTSGLTQNSTIWVLTTPNPITLGSSNLVFTLFSTVIDVQAGAGIAISQVGGAHTVCVNLGSNSGLNTSSGLVIDSSLAGSGLTLTSGKLNVNGALGGSASSIPVKFNAGNCLVLNCADINTALNAITGATNGLTKAGQQVKLGGTITGATTLILSSAGGSLLFTDSRVGTAAVGLQYTGNYGANFTALSIPDAQWVTGKTSCATVTASNGLTKLAGNNIVLGGTLTGNTNIQLGTNILRFNNGQVISSGATGQGFDSYNAYKLSGSTFLSVPRRNFACGNMAIGYQALSANTTGLNNIGIGYKALVSNLCGCANIAIGSSALQSNTCGTNNFAAGHVALYSNLCGSNNIAIGCQALQLNINGDRNIAMGFQSLMSACSYDNIALGQAALICDTTGCNNIAIGYKTLYLNSTGNYNIAIGSCAGYNEITSNKLYIANSSTNRPLIYGDFTANACCAIIYGAFKTSGATSLLATPAAGSISDSVIVWNSSDKQLKTVVGSSLGDKNNVYAKQTIISTPVTLTSGSSFVQLVNYAGAVTINLPATPINGQVFKIKDISGNALLYNITVVGNAGNIDGSANATINTSYGALELMWDTASSQWYSLAFIN